LEGLHDLKDRICSFENLMGAYRDAIKGKRYRNEVLDFSFNLGENLRSIQRDLLDMTYIVGPYREFYVRFPKPRLVMALGFRDRVVQWAIYRQINPYLDKRYITHSYGCRTGKGTLAAAECLHNWQQLISRKPDADDWYLIKGDISKYFYRVDHGEVLRTYAGTTDDAWFMWLIGTIINNPDVPFGLPVGMKPDDCPRSERLFDVGMPIGNLTSQETANLFLDRLDQYCKHVLHLHFYVRYMDDFAIFVKGKDEARRVFEAIRSYLLAELYLELSPKSRIQKATAPVEFVGHLITPHGIRLRKKTTRHIKRSLRHIMAAYAAGAMTYDRAMESAVCYYGMGKRCQGHNLQRWIVENFVLEREDAMNQATGPPGRGRKFFTIHENEDGTADVYLTPDIHPAAADGITDHDIAVRVVRGIVPYDGMEKDIRDRYDDWCESAETILL
jgi:retron-type reverse transcriptase